jgi:signal transduction histidine kinase
VPNLKLRTKIVLTTIVIPFTLIIFIFIIGTFSNRVMQEAYTDVVDFSIPLITQLDEVKLQSLQMISSANEIAVEGLIESSEESETADTDEEVRETEGEEGEEGEYEQFLTGIELYNTSIDSLRTIISQHNDIGDDDLELIDAIAAEGKVLISQATLFVEQSLNNTSIEELAETRESLEELEVSFLTTLNAMIAEETRELDERTNNFLTTRLVAGTLNITLLIATVISSIFWAVMILRSIARPLRDLSDVTAKLAEGDLNARATVYSSDELGQVAAAFNDMAQAVQKRDVELKELNQSLEKRVVERTADLKKARDEALALQRLAQENSRLKSEFLSTMSHELRTPLNAIEGFTSIMLGGMGIELSSRAEEMVRRVSSNSKRLLSLINDFLDLSRIESGRLELVQEPLSPTTLAQKWQKEVGILAEGKGIAFGVDVDPSLPEIVYGDEDALSKIAVNLLGNAFKFTRQGSVSLYLGRDDDKWTIIVSDTGIGIPPHAREYIFDEFRQVDSSSKREFGGTGLGLALVQKLSRALGGSVSLQSEVGAGSTFTVTLPLITELEGQTEGVLA